MTADLQALSQAQLTQTLGVIDEAVQAYAILPPAQKQFDDSIASCTTA